MNYKQNYFDFMESRQKLIRSKNDGVYYELHHILPKSIYPEYEKLPGNLVLLTSREHFIAHYLLTKIFEDKDNKFKMCCAFLRFCTGNKPNIRFQHSRLYEKIRAEHIELMKERFTGRKVSDEVKLKISIKEKGKKVSEKTKELLRQKALLQWENQENKKKHSDAMKNWYKNLSDEKKANMKKELSKPRGKYSDERIKNAKEAAMKAQATIKCVEDGSEWSCLRLSEEVNISRYKLKEMILKNEEINGKHYFYFKSYWRNK